MSGKNIGKENVALEKSFIILTVIMSIAVNIITLLSITLLITENSWLLGSLKKQVLHSENYKENGESLNAEALISFVGFWNSISGIILSIKTIGVTYYFSRNFFTVSEDVTEFLLHVEEERFIKKYKDSMNVFKKVNKALKYPKLILQNGFTYPGYLRKLTGDSNKISSFNNVTYEEYFRRIKSLYYDHRNNKGPVFLHSDNFQRYKVLINEIFEGLTY